MRVRVHVCACLGVAAGLGEHMADVHEAHSDLTTAMQLTCVRRLIPAPAHMCTCVCKHNTRVGEGGDGGRLALVLISAFLLEDTSRSTPLA